MPTKPWLDLVSIMLTTTNELMEPNLESVLGSGALEFGLRVSWVHLHSAFGDIKNTAS